MEYNSLWGKKSSELDAKKITEALFQDMLKEDKGDVKIIYLDFIKSPEFEEHKKEGDDEFYYWVKDEMVSSHWRWGEIVYDIFESNEDWYDEDGWKETSEAINVKRVMFQVFDMLIEKAFVAI
ncbi:hypothetical protein N9858_01355 [Flavobacteriaceae bacterium]|nr:hypothetical protein [Flavobacteriaceae bacterium]|tara:strand:+ start:128 stop:496 length:369 start_codon:yes stop_codon:yes gene_type:complete